MTSDIESAFEHAYAIGRTNVRTIELARRHCLNMTFTKRGGKGGAEQLSGLPIDAREVSCPIARGNSSAMNLDWVASEFYERHCVGCQHRRPTGELPNLASVMEERKAAAAAAAEAERLNTERRHRDWELRVERRRALITGADPAMSGALRDIGILDSEPGTGGETELTRSALGRLVALAERAPETFTADAVDHAVQLVEHVSIAAPLCVRLR